LHLVPSHVAPLLCAASHAWPHAEQFAVVFVGTSQPTRFGAVVVQSPHPPLHVYEHVVPLQLAVPCDDALHTLLQPPQFDVVLVAVSQPFVFGTVATQSPHPALQLVYEQVVPSHAAPLLLAVSHTLPQPPQFNVVLVCVSQPFVSGAVEAQFANPALQLAYEQVVPLQVAPLLLVASHTFPQPPQFVVEFVCVSQPFVFGALVEQSAHPPVHV
jgi:hypothetical protein